MSYVRVRDLEDELWTIPTGSLLHRVLQEEVSQGELIPTIPRYLIRNPNDCEEWTSGAPTMASLADLFDQVPSHHQARLAAQALRLSHFLRLRDRVLARGLKLSLPEAA